MTPVTPASEQLAELWVCLLVLKQLTELEVHHLSLRHQIKESKVRTFRFTQMPNEVKVPVI